MRTVQSAGRKAPRFLCDGCGAEVSMDEKRCPKCGKFFASIRCAKCGFAGDDQLFNDGCPVCGYSGAVEKKKTGGREEPQKSGRVPVWVYLLAAAIIAALGALVLTV